MSIHHAKSAYAFLGLSALMILCSGCVVVVGAGCDWDHSPSAWVEETVEMPIESAGLTGIEVRTDNGEVEFAGQPAGTPGSVRVRKKAGGASAADAQEALAAIEIVAERSGGQQKLGWQWKGIKRSRWHALVSFSIQAPGNVHLDIETHNGAVSANSLAGDGKIITHNGRVNVQSRNGKLHAETHNGEITVGYAGPSITLVSHNGEIKADLRESGSIRGDISTHNGAIEVSVGSTTAANLVAETDNGRVSCDAPITLGSAGKSRLEGKLGPGGDRLELSTHNGSISIKAG